LKEAIEEFDKEVVAKDEYFSRLNHNQTLLKEVLMKVEEELNTIDKDTGRRIQE
jgi:hypothetical protein